MSRRLTAFTWIAAAAAGFASGSPALAQGWEDLGDGVCTTGEASSGPALCLGADDSLYVAWSEEAGISYEIYLKRWNGSAWEELGGSATGGGISATMNFSTAPVVAVDRDGRVSVAWLDGWPGSDTMPVYFKRWEGGAWRTLGASASGPGLGSALYADSRSLSMALDSSGNPVLSWSSQAVSAYVVMVKRWTGSNWTGYSTTDPLGGLGGSDCNYAPSLAVDGAGNPAVAWNHATDQSSSIYLVRWDGAAWRELDGSASGPGLGDPSIGSGSPSLDLDPSGRPAVAWEAWTASSAEIHLKRWNGAAWEELGGSATGGGISATANESFAPSLKVDPSGRPVVAWFEWSRSGDETSTGVYLRRWTGTAWDEVDGSATATGITPSGLAGMSPSLALRSASRLAIACTEGLPGKNADIHLRRHWIVLPPSADGLGQRRLDGATSIAPGGTTEGETGFFAGARLSDPEEQPLRLQVEVKPVGVSFTGADADLVTSLVVPSGASAWVRVDHLALGSRLRWRARAVDSEGLPSPWVAFGSDPDVPAEADLLVRANIAPAVLRPVEVDPGTGLAMVAGAPVFSGGGIRFEAGVADPDGDRVMLEVELRRVDEAFTGVPTVTGGLAEGGTTASAVERPGPGSYRWQARGRDELGRAGPWISFGGNPESEADFVVVSEGSGGARSCAQAGRGLDGPGLFLLLVILSTFRLNLRRTSS